MALVFQLPGGTSWDPVACLALVSSPVLPPPPPAKYPSVLVHVPLCQQSLFTLPRGCCSMWPSVPHIFIIKIEATQSWPEIEVSVEGFHCRVAAMFLCETPPPFNSCATGSSSMDEAFLLVCFKKLPCQPSVCFTQLFKGC